MTLTQYEAPPQDISKNKANIHLVDQSSMIVENLNTSEGDGNNEVKVESSSRNIKQTSQGIDVRGD